MKQDPISKRPLGKRELIGVLLLLLVVPIVSIALRRAESAQLLGIIAAIAGIMLVGVYLRLQLLMRNLGTFARILGSEVKRPILGLPLWFAIDGRWQDRPVRITYSMAAFLTDAFTMSIEPRMVTGQWKSRDRAFPTSWTQLRSGRIAYSSGDPNVSTGQTFERKLLSDDEVRGVFGELTRAAVLVEQGDCDD